MAASPGSRAGSSAGWWPARSLPRTRQQAEVMAHFAAKRQRCRGSAGQTVGRQRAQQPAAVGNAQRALGGGSAPLPAEPRAELEDVAVETSPCRHFRRRSARYSSRVCSGHRGVNFYAQVGPRGVRKNSEICHSSRPAPSGAHSSHGWLRGHVEFRPTPLGAGSVSPPRPRSDPI